MNNVGRLQALFDSGTFLHPLSDLPNFVDLTRVLATNAGASSRAERSNGQRQIADAIGPADHYVFVLIDGMGVSAVERLPANSFIRSHMRLQLTTIFPSATTAALTSLSTGCWPADHGAPGWFTYMPDHELTAIPLQFVERVSGQPLDGLSAPDVFLRPAHMAAFTSESQSFFPSPIAESVFSAYSTGGTPKSGFDSLTNAVDLVSIRVRNARPTYTYAYYPALDRIGHFLGPNDPAYIAELTQIDEQLRRLAEALDGSARLVVSADHGCIPIADTDTLILRPGDELIDMLLALPSGEGRTTHYHVKAGLATEFRAQFERRLGDRYVLITREEACSLHLFGPNEPAAEARSRIGDFIAIGEGHAEILPEELGFMRGDHGGMTPDEMLIPLIVA